MPRARPRRVSRPSTTSAPEDPRAGGGRAYARPVLRVRLLGELVVEVAGERVAAPAGRPACELLAWLALHPGDHPRGPLAARLWPDVLDASARGSLRSAAWALRRALGPQGETALVAGRERIGLRCRTDLQDFEARVATGDLESAVGLARGPLLADLDTDWVHEARDEHAHAVSRVLAQLAAAAPTPAAAVPWARRRAALDPLDEEAARDLMRRLAGAGDLPAALATADRLAERLRTTLGLAPSGPTRELVAGLRAPRRPGTAAVAGAAPADGPALVGRDVELAALLDLLGRLRHGTGAVAMLTGEAGIGKTRLATEVLAQAAAAGMRTARCSAVDLGGAPPFALWAELLAEVARDLPPPDADAAWPEELGRLAPGLPRRLARARSHPSGADVQPELARARLFEAAVELVEHATADGALVLLFDDLHVADDPSLELVAHVARRIAALPVLLLLTRRSVPRRDAVDGLLHAARSRGVTVVEIEPEPLHHVQLDRIVRAVADLDPAQRSGVVTAADGNPLLALEGARAAARDDGRPPASLRALVRAAVLPLSPDARRAAELAALAARDLERRELSALATPAALEGAMACGLLRSHDGRVGFRHDLLREAVLGDLDDARRRDLHEQLGAALDGRPAESAWHLRRAGRDDLAVRHLVRAAAEAQRATAFEAAAGFLAEAAALAPGDSAVHLQLAEAYAMYGQREATQEAIARSLACLPPGDGVARATVHLRAARWFRGVLCDPTTAANEARAGLAALDPTDEAEPEMRAELLAVRAFGEVTMVGAQHAEATIREIEALPPEADGRALRRHDIATLRAFVELARGRLAEAEELFARSGADGERAGFVDMAFGGWSNAACLAAALGALPRALQHADRGDACAGDLPTIAFQLAAIRAFVLARMARAAEAREACVRQAEMAARIGSPAFAALAEHDAGLVALLLDDPVTAAELLDRALAGDPPIQRAEARLRRAEALALTGLPAEADAEIRAATQEPVRRAHRPAVLVARMCLAQGLSAAATGDVPRARSLLEDAARHWRRLGDPQGRARDHLASLVDLGRAPASGVLDPERELQRVQTALRSLQTITT